MTTTRPLKLSDWPRQNGDHFSHKGPRLSAGCFFAHGVSWVRDEPRPSARRPRQSSLGNSGVRIFFSHIGRGAPTSRRPTKVKVPFPVIAADLDQNWKVAPMGHGARAHLAPLAPQCAAAFLIDPKSVAEREKYTNHELMGRNMDDDSPETVWGHIFNRNRFRWPRQRRMRRDVGQTYEGQKGQDGRGLLQGMQHAGTQQEAGREGAWGVVTRDLKVNGLVTKQEARFLPQHNAGN